MSIFVKGNWKVRRAQESDIAALEQLIALSAHGLGASYYSAAKLDAALGTVFGVDRQLIRDGTYFGIGRAILNECEKAIRAAGFNSIELAATLPGVSFYAACGYLTGERSEVPLSDGLSLPIVHMRKKLR